MNVSAEVKKKEYLHLNSFNYYCKLLLKFTFEIVIFDHFIERDPDLKKIVDIRCLEAKILKILKHKIAFPTTFQGLNGTSRVADTPILNFFLMMPINTCFADFSEKVIRKTKAMILD